MKKFLITVDTEGDNQWNWKMGMPIKTENARYVERFQNMCERFGFVPVYLTNYEMAADEEFAAFLREKANAGLCEVGMHLHAWSSPPEYTLPYNAAGTQPYLIEYPPEIMRQKVAALTDFLEARIGIRPTTHRSGRWAMNSTYFDILMECGYNVDCSVTPGVDFSGNMGYTIGSKGSDYRKVSKLPYFVSHTTQNRTLLELPMTVRVDHSIRMGTRRNLRSVCGSVIHSIRGRNAWLRAFGNNLDSMLHILQQCKNGNEDYAMFMLHSSELMPGGSPYFPDEDAVQHLYSDMECVFRQAAVSFEGCSIKEYVQNSNMLTEQ